MLSKSKLVALKFEKDSRMTSIFPSSPFTPEKLDPGIYSATFQSSQVFSIVRILNKRPSLNRKSFSQDQNEKFSLTHCWY